MEKEEATQLAITLVKERLEELEPFHIKYEKFSQWLKELTDSLSEKENIYIQNIHELELTIRAANCIGCIPGHLKGNNFNSRHISDEFITVLKNSRIDKKGNSILYIGDIIALGELNLLRIPGLGKHSLMIIKYALESKGVSFEEKIPNWLEIRPK